MLEKALFIFSIYLPLQLAINPTPLVDLASIRILIIFLFLFWLSVSLLKKKLIIPVDAISLLLYSFLFFASISILLAENAHWGTRKLLFLYSIFPLYLVFCGAATPKHLLKISSGLVWGSFMVALIGLIQFSSQFIFGIEKVYTFWGKFIAPIFLGNAFSAAVLEYPSWLVNISGKTIFRTISVFPDPHMLSFYLGMTAPLALALYYYHKKNTSFYLLAFIFIFTAALLTFSRGGYLGLLISALFVILLLLRDARLSSQKMAGLVISALLLVVTLSVIEPVRTRFLDSFDFEEGSNRGRIELWVKAFQVIKENPLGVGIDNLPLEFLPTASYRDPIYAHSLYLDIAAELGIFSLLSLVAILFLSLRNSLLYSKDNVLYLGIFASLIFFSVYALVETPLYSVHILPLLLILLSFSHAPKKPKIS